MPAVDEICNLSKLTTANRNSARILNSNVRPSSSKNCRSEIFSVDKDTRSKSDLNFKHVSETELDAVLKQVRRANQKKRDEETWQRFLKSKQETNHEGTYTAQGSVTCSDCGRLEPGSSRLGYSVPQQEEISRKEGDETGEEPDFRASIDYSVSHTYQLGPGLIKRLQDLLATVGKMTSLLLTPCLHTQYEDEDAERTIKRSLEFDSMFARNHLYEIQRLLKDAKQLATGKFLNTAELESKISAALKCVTQALQVYTRHVSKGSRVKYQQVVPIFQNISSIESLLEHLTGQRLFPLRQEIQVSCSYMKQVLLEISATETKTVSTVSHKPVKVRHKHKPSADLSMYNRRQKAEWRRKSASLARARFGMPSKKHSKRSGSAAQEQVVQKHNVGDSRCDATGHTFCSQAQQKEPTNAKEAPFRNSTRAVPEEQVTTMMEMIPNESMEDCGLSIDDNTFEALKLLNGVEKCVVPQRHESTETQSQENVAFSLVRKLSLDDLSPTPRSHPIPLTTDPSPASVPEPHTKLGMAVGSERDGKPTSARSTNEEASNVQLVCLREEEAKPKTSATLADDVNGCTVLTIDEVEKREALEYHQKMIDFHNSNPHYKDGKAIGIIDRLANQILTEMVLDFQRNEMDQVIRTLYNLEFE